MNQKLVEFNKKQRRTFAELPELQAGDVVKIYRKIKEGAKERTQMFQGMVIALRGGQSASRTITVRKVLSRKLKEVALKDSRKAKPVVAEVAPEAPVVANDEEKIVE